MGYDWVFEVLEDLKSFALANGLAAVAAKVDETLKVAELEIAGLAGQPAKVPPRRSSKPH